MTVAASTDVLACGIAVHWQEECTLGQPLIVLVSLLCDEQSYAECRHDGVIPSAEVEAAQPALAELNEKVAPLVEQYVALMEKIKLKDGIRMAMNVSFAGNKFFQVRDCHVLMSSSIYTCG